LIVDVLSAVLNELYGIALAKVDTAPHPEQITARLDDFASAITTVQISGSVEEEIRQSARDWYQQDKSAVIKGNEALEALLTHIVDEVIGKRKARAFLFPSNQRDAHIEQLFDSRLLHVLKRNVSSHDNPGARYDVYKIDYGCYVDLINTTKAPVGLFETEDDGYVEVPRDDYRSIRRAILDPKALMEVARE
jgi:hypothetical protein